MNIEQTSENEYRLTPKERCIIASIITIIVAIPGTFAIVFGCDTTYPLCPAHNLVIKNVISGSIERYTTKTCGLWNQYNTQQCDMLVDTYYYNIRVQFDTCTLLDGNKFPSVDAVIAYGNGVYISGTPYYVIIDNNNPEKCLGVDSHSRVITIIGFVFMAIATMMLIYTIILFVKSWQIRAIAPNSMPNRVDVIHPLRVITRPATVIGQPVIDVDPAPIHEVTDKTNAIAV